MKSDHSHGEPGSLPGDRGGHPDAEQPEARAEVRVVREAAQGLGNAHSHARLHLVKPEIEVINTVAYVPKHSTTCSIFTSLFAAFRFLTNTDSHMLETL